MKSAENLREEYKKDLKKKNWVLHFDGKCLEEKVNGKVKFIEHQVVVLKNKDEEVRLAVLVLPNSKSQTIYLALKEVLDYYDLWASIAMIVTDTCAVNTGRLNGVVALIANEAKAKGLKAPLAIGCQQHILDTMLRHCLDQLFSPCSTAPTLPYWFIDEIENNYHMLKERFSEVNTDNIILDEDVDTSRDDMRFLGHLCNVYSHFKTHNIFPKIKFSTLPSKSNARWNSRGIFVLLAFILLPHKRDEKMSEACNFVLDWSKIWFSDHKFNPLDFNFLEELAFPYPKALNSLKRFWNKEPSPLESERSNICAERAVKILQSIKPMCRSKETLNKRFLLTNKIV